MTLPAVALTADRTIAFRNARGRHCGPAKSSSKSSYAASAEVIFTQHNYRRWILKALIAPNW
jgi:hypothetical protein